jgi:hypothetical protein
MKRSSLNFAVDIVTFLAALGLVSTGLLLRYVLPPGSRGGAGLSVWERSRHDWGDIHFYIAAGIGFLVIAHLALHWGWTVQMMRRMFGSDVSAPIGLSASKRNALGAGVLVLCTLVIGAFLYFAQANVKIEGNERARRGAGVPSIRARGPQDGERGRRHGEAAGPRRHRGNSRQVPTGSNPSSENEQQSLAGGL